jgi:hypothetical protein
MPASAADVIRPALDHVKRQLFAPFRLGQWVRIAVTGLLAGELGGAGGCSFRGIPWSPRGSTNPGRLYLQSAPAAGPLMVIGIALLVVVALILFILFLYISSRMRFVLFDSIVARECHIRRFWRQRSGPALRYFVFQLLFALSMLVGVGVLVGAAVAIGFSTGWFQDPRAHVVQLVLAGIIFVGILAALMITGLLITVLTKDFVVPQMALEDVGVTAGWSRLWTMLKTEKIQYLGYIGLKIALAIVNAILIAVAAFLVILVFLIPLGIIALIAVFGGRAIGLTWNVATITIAVVAGCAALLALISTIIVISAPTAVFFPAYSLYFLAERYPVLHRLMYPPPSPPPPEPLQA